MTNTTILIVVSRNEARGPVIETTGATVSDELVRALPVRTFTPARTNPFLDRALMRVQRWLWRVA